ncbi:excalibur calcium-binding domain-containing protein [Pseudarthrobacter sp. PS3-L1]|uniref:excalibur calcium-binding domain-containing protein n=1 Tax=Pseudarthrobacter sp. PS3-L1 TaxID=3046207 RepID=UPI0024BBBAFA|nr:excalibur calcium-binding domain-containing protein [Pseudarthrobacter sp. PS3-L1]MDJ0319813.1 excalibur calcium-binding domain-containing protein [Pseudarthrobacter sp. PS3-L1]
MGYHFFAPRRFANEGFDLGVYPNVRLKKILIASLAGTAVILSSTAVPASAVVAKSYKNCTELNKVYPHGVGKTGARDKTTGKPVTTFRVNSTVYSYNDGAARRPGEYDLDRDNDGIACEKR